MKVEELMIGDWVIITLRNKIGKVYRIDEANGKGNGWVAVINGDYHETHLEPILLTPEILEKNGFVEWEDKCYRWEYAEGIYINADFTAQEPWAHISNRCYSATPVCRYVHQLQHALRLCGIEKEIVL